MKARAKACYGLVLSLLYGLAIAAQPLTQQDCPDDTICYFRVPGAVCADGTPTGYTITYRKNAENLMIYLEGGGACWSRSTCEAGTAQVLTERKFYTGNYFDQPEYEQTGWRDLNSPSNPVANGYNIAFIPYCTGDVFAGDNDANYGTPSNPYVMRHRGFRNVGLILKELKARFPNPPKVLFSGTSAGGLGVSWNLRKVAEEFSGSRIYVINDAGLLFKPPFVNEARLGEVFSAWRADQTMPPGSLCPGECEEETLTSRLIKYNQTAYPDVQYGFISSYKDVVMSYFSKLLLAPDWTSSVRNIMISLANDEFTLSNNYRVFYLDDWWHGYLKKDMDTIVSEGTSLGDWIKAMLASDVTNQPWSDVRPDLNWVNGTAPKRPGIQPKLLRNVFGIESLRRESEHAVQRNFGEVLHTFADLDLLEAF